jgi:hypothetical protein
MNQTKRLRVASLLESAPEKAMKYYLYISDAKVDMLFPQVPHDIKKKVALEFKMDLKLLSASRKTETESEDNRVARLETVVDFIRQYGNVGSIDAPDEYIDDTLDMQWGSYADTSVVYFGGETNKTILGLGGSMKHLLGNAGIQAAPSNSATPFLMKYLTDDLAIRYPDADAKEAQQSGLDLPSLVATAVKLTSTNMRGPQQKVAFLAKKLAYGPVTQFGNNPVPEDKNVLLATPLYISMAD